MAINQKPHVHKNVICANMFVKKGGKILLLKRSRKKKYAPGVVHPIGGKVDPSENPMEAARRELFEEAGIKVKNVRLEAVLLEVAPVKEEREDWLIFHFSGDFDSGKLKTTEEGDLVWLKPAVIKEQKLFPSVKKVIDKIINPDDGTVFATMEYNSKKDAVIKIREDNCIV